LFFKGGSVITRKDAKTLDPDITGWHMWFHTIYVDDNSLISFLINTFLIAIKSKKRVRWVVHEDAVRATGVWTQEEAGDVAARLVIGKEGNFTDPKLRKGLLRPLQYLGWIK